MLLHSVIKVRYFDPLTNVHYTKDLTTWHQSALDKLYRGERVLYKAPFYTLVLIEPHHTQTLQRVTLINQDICHAEVNGDVTLNPL